MLLDEGFEVVGVDCGFYRGGWLYNDAHKRPFTHTKDIRRVTAQDVEGFDAVSDPLGELNQRTTYAINHHRSVMLARACREARPRRFVCAPSCSVYGPAGNGGECDERSAPNPQTA
jgi:nucleoside-diphosphate-sugar epimerase